MDACGCDGYASPFDERSARTDRDTYHANGPDRTTRMLLDMIEAEDPRDLTLLDVGGGIGIIDIELLRAGARHAVLVPHLEWKEARGKRGEEAVDERDHHAQAD